MATVNAHWLLDGLGASGSDSQLTSAVRGPRPCPLRTDPFSAPSSPGLAAITGGPGLAPAPPGRPWPGRQQRIPLLNAAGRFTPLALPGSLLASNLFSLRLNYPRCGPLTCLVPGQGAQRFRCTPERPQSCQGTLIRTGHVLGISSDLSADPTFLVRSAVGTSSGLYSCPSCAAP